MKLNYDKKSNDPTYFIQQGFRNGKKTSTRNVCRIGKHSELLAMGIENPLEYAREQVAKANEEYKNGKVDLTVHVDFDEKVASSGNVVSESTLKGIGYFFLQAIYQKLGIRDFLKNAVRDSGITFDPDEVNRFLTFARILEPDSKLGTYDHLSRYYESPGFDYQHIMRTLDILYKNYDAYITSLYENSLKIAARNTSVCYFDCSNYYFEIESQDPDYVDEVTGEIIRGFRRYGPSKEHRPNPLVEMGLFIDADGIPLSMCIAAGSDNEQTLAIPLEKKLSAMLKGKKFIYCADAGLGSLNIRSFNSLGGRAFIVTQSVKKLSNVMKQAVFNDCDYRLLSDNSPVSIRTMREFDRFDEDSKGLYQDLAYKEIIADHAIDVGLTEEVLCANGKKKTVKSKALLKQKIIITFSRKALEYQRYIRNRQIERARAMLNDLDPESYRKGPHDVTRFIKRSSKGANGEKASDSYILDEEKIAEEEMYDGYYAVATNLSDSAKDILAVNSQRYKIEDCFRVMKTNLSTRPVFHRSPEHITAHFLLCYTALLIFRLLQKKLDIYGQTLKPGPKHFTADQVIETLRNMEVANVNDLYYMATYKGSDVLDALNAVFDLKLDRKNYAPKELNRKIKKLQ